MKKVAIALTLVFLFAVPAVAFNDFESGIRYPYMPEEVAALYYDKPDQEDYNQVVDELVKTTAELEQVKIEAADEKKDAIALAVGAGVFIGAGGVGVAIKFLFPIVKLIPFL